MSRESEPVELDVRGEVCPYPELLTRKRLGELEAGTVLHVITDHAAATRNVPDMVSRDGAGEVLEIRSLGRAAFVIVIRRAES